MGSIYLVGGVVWLALAVAAGATGAVARLHPPLPQVVLVGLTAALVIGYRRAQRFRAWLDGVSLRAILRLHLFRYVGIAFLVLYSRGALPYAFAVPGGWGDIASATWALIVMMVAHDFATRRLLIAAWNTFGLLDILMVVVTATRMFMSDAGSMQPLLRLPLSLLPTFLVPLVIASHLLVYRRLMQTARAPERSAAV